MIDKLIHNADGSLQEENPYKVVGMRGLYRVDQTWGFFITKESVEAYEKNKDSLVTKNNDCFYGQWVYGLPYTPRLHSGVTGLLKHQFDIVHEGSDKYFTIKERH